MPGVPAPHPPLEDRLAWIIAAAGCRRVKEAAQFEAIGLAVCTARLHGCRCRIFGRWCHTRGACVSPVEVLGLPHTLKPGPLRSRGRPETKFRRERSHARRGPD